MNRKMYLSVPIVLVGALILSCLLLVTWIILLIPVMIYPRLVSGFNPANKVTEVITRRTIQAAMKGTKG